MDVTTFDVIERDGAPESDRLNHLPAVWPVARYLTSLSPGFLIYQMRIMTLNSKGGWGGREHNYTSLLQPQSHGPQVPLASPPPNPCARHTGLQSFLFTYSKVQLFFLLKVLSICCLFCPYSAKNTDPPSFSPAKHMRAHTYTYMCVHTDTQRPRNTHTPQSDRETHTHIGTNSCM